MASAGLQKLIYLLCVDWRRQPKHTGRGSLRPRMGGSTDWSCSIMYLIRFRLQSNCEGGEALLIIWSKLMFVSPLMEVRPRVTLHWKFSEKQQWQQKKGADAGCTTQESDSIETEQAHRAESKTPSSSVLLGFWVELDMDHWAHLTNSQYNSVE